jgi:hypothetical protein
MRRTTRAVGVVVLGVLMAMIVLPAVALAADASSYEGTYAATGDGTDKNGKKGQSAVTIWVEDLGDTARVTFRVDKFGITVDAEGPEQWSGADQVTIPIAIDKYGVDASGEITLAREGDTWVLGGTGDGKAVTYEGTGQAAGTRTATGVALPSMWKQTKDLFSGIFGGPPDDEPVSVKGVKVETVEPASALAPAEAAPPIPTDAVLAGSAALFIFLLLFLFLL